MKSRFPWSRDSRRIDPSGVHLFEATHDPGLAAMASRSQGGMDGYGGVTPAAITGAFQRPRPCAVPGCGRPKADPMHGVAESD